MESRDSVLLGYSPQSQRYLFVNHHHHNNHISRSSSSSSRMSSDIDFSDVFGGPPRRGSAQEARHSFNGFRAIEYHEDDEDEDDEDDDNEKPVFGDEGGGIIARRRYPNSEDFFGDIFKGKELYSLSCSPRNKLERDSLSSAPGSRVLSPVRPLPPRADHQQLLIGGSNHPAQFSLPSRLITGTELPTFGSPPRSQHKNKDGGSNGSSNYSHSPLSRLSNQADDNRAQEVLESNVRLRTYLSKELSLSSEESVDLEKSEARGTANKLEKQSSASDSDGSQAQGKGAQFHFSIYKWASKGSPMDMPLRPGKSLGSKEKGKVPRSSSFNGWLNGDEMAKRSPRVTPDDRSLDKQKDGRVELVHDVEESSLPPRKSESSRIHQVDAMKQIKEETEDVPSLAKMELSKGKRESSFVVSQEASKTESKPVRSLFSVNDLLMPRTVSDTVAKNDGSKESKVKSTKNPASVFYVEEDVKIGHGRSVNVDNGDVEKANVGGLERSFRSIIGKDGSGADTRIPSRVEQMNDVEEANLRRQKSESSIIHQVVFMKHTTEETEAVPSLAEMELSKGKVESSFVVMQETPKTEFKPIRSLFYVNDHEPGNNMVAKNDRSKENKVKNIKKPAADFDAGEDVKNRSVNVDNRDVEKANVGGSERSLSSSIGKNKGGGKVKDFVKIFNQEPAGKPEVNVESQRQNSWRKETGKPRMPDASSAKPTGFGKEPNPQSKDKVVDASILVDESPRRSEKQKPETTPDSTNSISTPETNLVSGTSLLGSAPDVSEAIFEEFDDSFHDDFLMEEILEDDYKLPEETTAKSEAEEVKAIDDKIRNWSRGKEGNIRSLLSTLQYVLWPGSGWKNVPLVDIVEGNAVRKPYQKALLCLHPDKLQQKGATAHQKYIAEKVFDILQEAWTHFNSLGSV